MNSLLQHPSTPTSTVVTGRYNSAEDMHIVTQEAYSKINGLRWAVNAVGYIELYWEGEADPFLVLSGNGSWDLAAFGIRSELSGHIKIRPVGFSDLDSFTLIITGAKQKGEENDSY